VNASLIQRRFYFIRARNKRAGSWPGLRSACNFAHPRCDSSSISFLLCRGTDSKKESILFARLSRRVVQSIARNASFVAPRSRESRLANTRSGTRSDQKSERENREIRACSAAVSAATAFASVHINTQTSLRSPRGRDGNSRIIPISSGNFVAQFVSRKEYDITRAGRIVATTAASAADGRSTCETLACLVNNGISYSSCPPRRVAVSFGEACFQRSPTAADCHVAWLISARDLHRRRLIS